MQKKRCIRIKRRKNRGKRKEMREIKMRSKKYVFVFSVSQKGGRVKDELEGKKSIKQREGKEERNKEEARNER